jgi:hypothetical protein
VQVDPDVEGRPRIVGVEVRRPDGVTAEDLRSIPVHRLEVGLALLQTPPEDGALGFVFDQRPTRRTLRIPANLFATKGRRYGDEFYKKVGELYSLCVEWGLRPAPAIAEANEKPIASVHRWVAEARRRGLLAPARMPGGEG